MITALRPMSTGEVLDRTFNLYRNHFLLFAGIATVQVLCTLIGVAASFFIAGRSLESMDSSSPGAVIVTALAYVLLLALFYLIGYALGAGATIFAVSKLHLGYPARIWNSYKELRPLVWRTIRIVLSIFLRVLGGLIVTEFAAGVVSAASAMGRIVAGGPPSPIAIWVTAIMMLLVVAAGLVWTAAIACRNSLAVPACLLERLPARQAMQRSRWLTKGFLRRIFLIFFLMGILAIGLYYGLAFPVFLFAQAHPGIISTIAQLVAAFLAMMLAFPIGTIAICLTYYDHRVRKEAFDLQLMMESLRSTPPQPQFPAATPIA